MLQLSPISVFIMHPMPLAQSQVIASPRLLDQMVTSLTYHAVNLFEHARGCSLSALRWQSQESPEPFAAFKALSVQDLLKELRQGRHDESATLALIEIYLKHPDVQQRDDLVELYHCFWSSLRYQQAILLSIGRSRHPASMDFLREVYRAAWHQLPLRKTIVRALGLHGSAEAVARLVQIGRANLSQVGLLHAVIIALGYSRCASAAQALKQFLAQDAKAEIKRLVYRALGATGSDTAVEILRQLLKTVSRPQEKQQLQAAIRNAYDLSPDEMI